MSQLNDSTVDNDPKVVDQSQQQDTTQPKPTSIDMYGMLQGGADYLTMLQSEGAYGVPVVLGSKENFFANRIKEVPQLAEMENGADILEKEYQAMINIKNEYDKYKKAVGPDKYKNFPKEYVGRNITVGNASDFYTGYSKPERLISKQELAYINNAYLDKDDKYRIREGNSPDNGYYGLTQDENGNPVWKQMKNSDYIKGTEILSIWGPRKVEADNALGSLGRGFVGGIALIPKGVGSTIEAIGDLFGDETNDSKWTDLVGHRMMNSGNYFTLQHLSEAQDPFSGLDSFLWSFGNGTGQLLSMIGTSYAGGFGLAASGVKWAAKGGEFLGLAVGAMEGGIGLYEEAKEMGWNDRDAAKMFFAAAAGTLVSEVVLGANVVQRGFGRQGRDLARQFSKEYTNIAKAAGNNVDNVKSAFLKRYYNEFRHFADRNAYTRVGVGAFEETVEENIEGGIHYAEQLVGNVMAERRANNIINTYAGVEFKEITQEDRDMMGAKDKESGRMNPIYPPSITHTMTRPDGTVVALKEEEYTAIVDDITLANNILDESAQYDPHFNMSEGWMAGITTLSTLGMGGVTNTMGIRNKRIQDFMAAEQAMNEHKNPGRSKQFDQGLIDGLKENMGYLAGQDKNGNAVDNIEESVAMDMVRNIRAQINAYKELIKEKGWTNTKVLEAIGGKDVAAETIIDIDKVTQMRNAIETAEDKNAISFDGKEYSQEQLETKIAEKADIIEKKTKINEWGTTEYMRERVNTYSLIYENIAAKDHNKALVYHTLFKDTNLALNAYKNDNQAISDFFKNKEIEKNLKKFKNIYGNQFTEMYKASGMGDYVAKLMTGQYNNSEEFAQIIEGVKGVMNDLTAKMETIQTMDGSISNPDTFLAESKDYSEAVGSITGAVELVKGYVAKFNQSKADTDTEFDEQIALDQATISDYGSSVENKLNDIKALQQANKSKKSRPAYEELVNMFMQEEVDKINEIREKANKDKSILEKEENANVILRAAQNIEGLRTFLDMKKQFNKADSGRPNKKYVDNNIQKSESFSYQTDEEVYDVNGVGITTQGNKLSNEFIGKMDQFISDIANGVNDGDLSVKEMAEISGKFSESLKSRDQKRRVFAAFNQASIMKGLDGEDIFSNELWTKIMRLHSDSKAMRNDVLNPDGSIEEKDVVKLELLLNEVKSDMHKALNNDEGVDFVVRHIVKLAAQFKAITNENAIYYTYSQNLDGSYVSEAELDSGKITIGEQVINLNQEDLFAFTQLGLEEYKRSGKVTDKLKTRVVTSRAIDRQVQFLNEVLNIDNNEFYAKYYDLSGEYNYSEGDRYLSLQQENTVKMAFMGYTAKRPMIAPHGYHSEAKGQKGQKLNVHERKMTNDLIKRAFKDQDEKMTNKYLDEIIKGGVANIMFEPKSFFIQGTGGAGKTTYILGTLMKMLDKHVEEQGLPKKKVVLVGPNSDNTAKQAASIGKQKNLDGMNQYTISEFAKSIKDKSLVLDKNTIVVIDEVSLVFRGQLNDFRNNITDAEAFFVLGDPQQPKYNEQGGMDDNTGIQMDKDVFKLPLVEEVHRADVKMISDLQNVISTSMTSPYSNTINMPLGIAHNDDMTRGVYANHKGNLKKFEDMFLEHREKFGKEDRVIIFANETDAESFKARHKEVDESSITYIKPKDPLKENKSAQGLEYKYVYAAMVPGETMSDMRIFKTAVGRAKKFVAIMGDNKGTPVNNNIVDLSVDNNNKVEAANNIELELFNSQQSRIKELGTNKSDEKEVDKNKTNNKTQGKPVKNKNTDTDQEEDAKNAELIKRKVDTLYENALDIINEYGYAVDETNAIDDLISYLDEGTLGEDYTFDQAQDMLENISKLIEELPKAYKDNESVIDDENITEEDASIDPMIVQLHHVTNNIRYSMAIMPADEKTTSVVNSKGIEYAYNEILRKRVESVNTGDIKLKFHPSIDLYDLNTGDVKTHYNVVTLYRGDLLLGTLFQPYTDQEQINRYRNDGYRRSLENKMHSDMANFKNNPDDERGADALNAIYQMAENHIGGNHNVDIANYWDPELFYDKVQIESDGSFFFAELNDVAETRPVALYNDPQAVQYNFNQDRSFKQYFDEVIAAGGSFMGVNGEDITTTSGEIKIEQKYATTNRGRKVVDYVYARRGKGFPYVPVEIKGGRISEMPAHVIDKLMGSISDEIEELNKDANLAKSKKGTSERQRINMKYFALSLNNSIMMHTISYNRSLIINKDNGKINSAFNGLLTYNKNGYLDVNEEGGPVETVKKLKQAYDIVVANGAFLPSIKAGDISQNIKKGIRIDGAFVAAAYTNAVRFNTGAADIYDIGNNNSNNDPYGISNAGDVPFARKSGRVNEPTNLNDQVDYLKIVFGEDFINNNLVFSNSLMIGGVPVYGAVGRMKMFIETVRGLAQKNVAKHEAVHFAMKYIIDDKSYNALIKDARALHKALGKGSLSKDKAEEFIAEINEGLHSLKPKSLIGKFLMWLRKVMNSILNNPSVTDFLNDLNNGVYADSPVTNYNGEEVSPMSKEGIDYDAEYENDGLTELLTMDVNALSMDRVAMANYLGGDAKLSTALSIIRSYIKRANPARLSIDKRGIVTFDEYVTVATQALNDVANSKLQTERVKYAKPIAKQIVGNRPFIEALVEMIMPQINFSDNTVESTSNEIIRDDFNAKDIGSKMSAVLANELNGVEFHEFKWSNGALRKVAKTQSEKADGSKLRAVLGQIFKDFRTDTVDMSLDPAQRMFEHMWNKIQDQNANGTNENLNMLASFLVDVGYAHIDSKNRLKRGLPTKVDENTRLAPYHYYDNNVRELLYNKLGITPEHIMSSINKDGSIPNMIMQKTKSANEYINALMSLYASIQEAPFISVESKVDRNGRYFQSKKRNNTNLEEQKRIFKSAMMSRFFTETGLKNITEKLVMPNVKKKPYRSLEVTKNAISIYYGGSDVVTILKWDDAQDKFVWVAKQDQETLNDFFRAFGIYTTNATRNAILGVNYSAENFDINSIAEGFGMIAYTLRSYFETKKDNVYKQRIDSFVAKNNLIPLQLSELEDQESEDEGNLHIDTFYDYVAALADVETQMNIINKRGYTYTPEGKSINTMMLGSHLSRLLLSSKGSQNPLTTYYINQRNNMTDDEISRSPVMDIDENGNPVFIDPMLNGKIKVANMSYSTGIEDLFKGKDVKRLTDADMVNHVVFGHWLTSIIRDTSDQDMKLPMLALSDSGFFPVFDVIFGNNKNERLFKIVREDGVIKKIDFNNKTLVNIFNDKFDVMFKKASISLEKWTGYNSITGKLTGKGIVPIDEKRFNAQVNEVDRAKMLIETVKEYLGGKKQMNANNTNLQMLSKQGMVEGVDYTIYNNKIRIGYNAEMSYKTTNRNVTKSPFTLDNYQVFKEALSNEEVAVEIINNIMNDRMYSFNEMMYQSNNIKNRRGVSIADWTTDQYYKKLKNPVKVNTSLGEVVNDYEYNPLYKAFVYSHFLFNDSLVNTVVGNEFQAKDPRTLVKYAKGLNAQGHIPIHKKNPIYGLGETFNVVKITDMSNQSEHFKKMLGIKDDYTFTDGVMLTNRLFTQFLNESYGGDYSYMNRNDNTLKTVASGIDAKTGLGQFKKSATYTLNDDMYYQNREMFGKMVKFMLSGNLNNIEFNDIGDNNANLHEKFMESMNEGKRPSEAFKDVADYVKQVRLVYGVDLLEGTISRIEFKTTQKLNTDMMNFMPLDKLFDYKDPLIAKQNTSDELFILNANQSLDNRTVTDISQIKLISNIGSRNGAKISNIDSHMTDRIFKGIVKDITNAEEFKELFKTLGADVVNKIKGASSLTDILSIPNIDENIPTIMNKLWPSFMKRLNNAIDYKVTGSKMVQAPGELFANFYEIETEYGIVKATQEDIDNGLFKVKEGTKRSPLEHTRISDELKMITPSEVAMPFFYAEEFGIDRNERHSLNAILNFRIDGKNINLRAYLKSKVADYYTDKEAVREALKEFIETNFKKFDDKSFFKKHLKQEFESAEDLTQYYWSFMQSLDVFAARIPSTSKGLAFAGEVTSFTYDSGTTIYVSSEKILFDDSDYDIDQLTVLFRDITSENGIPTVEQIDSNQYDKQSSRALINEKFNLLYNDWVNYDQKDQLFIRLDTKAAEKRANDNIKNKTSLNHDFATNVKSFVASHTGKNMVSVFANMIHVYSKLSQLSPAQRQKHLGENINFTEDGSFTYEDKINYIIDTLGEMLQISVDNPKLMILDMLNINSESGAFIAAMALSSKSKEEIYNKLGTKKVQDIFQKAYDGNSIGNTRFDTFDYVENIIRNMELTDEEAISDTQKKRINGIKTEIKKLEKDRDNGYKMVKLFDEGIEDLSTADIYSFIKDKKQFAKTVDLLAETDESIGQFIENMLDDLIEAGYIKFDGTTYTHKGKDYNEAQIMDIVKRNYLFDSKSFDDYMKASVLDINDKIDKLKAELNAISDLDTYMDNYRKGLANDIEEYKDIYNMLIIGESIKRVVPIFRLNKKLPSSQYQLYDFVNNLEFNTGKRIKDLLSGKQSDYNWRERGDNMLRSNVNHEWNGSTQATINTFAEGWVNEFLKQMEVEGFGRKNITIKTTGESGFDQAIAIAFANRGINVKIYQEKDGRFTNAAKRDTYDTKEEKFSSKRFKNIESRGNVEIIKTDRTNQMGVFADMIIENKKKVTDIDVFFNPFDQKMFNTLNKGKGINLKGGLATRESDGVAKGINKIVAKLKDQADTDTTLGRDGNYEISIMGPDLSMFKVNRLSAYERWENREIAIRSQFNDLPGMINSFRNIKSYLKIVDYANDMAETFIWNGMDAQYLEQQYLMEQKVPRLNGQTYTALKQQMQNVYVDGFFSSRKAEKYTKVNMTMFNGVDLIGAYGSNLTDSIAEKVNLNNYLQSLYFMMEFPHYIKQVQEEQITDNMFVNSLVVDNNKLVVRDHNTMTDMEVAVLSESFNELDENTKAMFFSYNLLKNGFNAGGYYSLSNFMGKYGVDELSSFMANNKDLLGSTNARTFFTPNATVNDKKLHPYFSKNSKGKYMPPNYSLVYKTVDTNYYGKKYQISVPGMLLDDQEQAQNPKYIEAYNQLSGYMKRLPVSFLSNSTEETVRLNDVENLREWLNDGRTTINFTMDHDFKGLIGLKDGVESTLNYIRVNNDVAYLPPKRNFSNSLTVIKTDKSDYSKAAKGKIEPDPVASKPVVRTKAVASNMFGQLLDVVNPNMNISLVNNKTTAHPGLKAYIENGTIVYNTDLVTMDTLFHEIAHVYLWDGYGTEVMDIAREEIELGSDLVERIRAAYPNLSGEDLVYEVAATMMGLSSQEKAQAILRNRPKTVIEKIVDAVKRAWNSIVSFINGNNGTNIDITSNDTIRTVTEKMIQDVISGNFTADQQKIMMLQDLHDSTLTASKNINTINDLDDALLLKDTKRSVDEYLREKQAISIWNSLKKSRFKKLYSDGNTYDFTAYVKLDNKTEALRIIQDKYLPGANKDGSVISSSIFRWLKNTEDGGKGKIDTITDFVKANGRQNNPRFQSKIQKFAQFLGWSDTTVAYTPEEFGNIFPSLRDALPVGLDKSIRIIVHRKDLSEDGGLKLMDVSLVKMFPYSIKFGGRGLDHNNIGSNFFDKTEASRLGLKAAADLAEVEKLKMALITMTLKNKLGNAINIRATGLAEMNDVKSDIRYTKVDMIDALDTLRALSSSDEFVRSLSSDLKAVLQNPKALNLTTYSPDYIETLYSVFEEKKSDGLVKEVQEQLSLLTSNRGNIKKLVEALRLYKVTLDRALSNELTRDKVDMDEYNLISEALFEMNTNIDKSKSNTKGTNAWRSWMMNQNDQGNRIIQSFYNTLRNNMSIISGLFMKEQDKLAEETKKVIKMHLRNNPSQKVSQYVADVSEKYFDKFFIYETVNGKRYNTFTIHHDINNPKTREAIQRGDLTQEEFAYSQFIADQIEMYMKDLIRAKFKYSYSVFKNGKFDEAKLEEMVEDYYAENWAKGRIPLIRKSVPAYMSEGKILSGLKKFNYESSNPEQAFQDILQDDHALIDTEMTSVFLSQIGGNGISELGDDKRLARMGLESVDGNIIIKDGKANEYHSLNLFNIARYMAMDAISKPIMDDRVIPAYREALITARSEEITLQNNKNSTETHIKTLFDKVVLGKHKKLIEDSKLVDTVEGFGRMMIRMTTFNGVALSVPVAVTSMTANTFEAIMTSVAVNISGANPYDLFNFKDYASAIKEYTTNFKKVAAIMRHYQVIEADRWDQLVNPKYDVTIKHPYHSNAAHFMNRWTDLSARAIAAVAQMKHDGTWNAHSVDENGNVVYDYKMDKRFDKVGTDKKQQELKKWLTEALRDDERVEQEQGDKDYPVRAYDVQDQRKLEFVGSQFVVGVYNKEASLNGDSIFLVNAIMQFKKFMVTKTAERLGGKIEAFEGGKKVIREDEEGNMIRAWQTYEKEGSWVTAGKILLKSTPFVASVLSKYEWVTETRSIWQYNQMSDLEKYNLARSGLDLLFIGAAYLAYTGMSSLSDGFDEDDWTVRYKRIWNSIMEGMQTAALTSPEYLMDMFSSIPIITMVRNMWNLIMMRDVQKNASYVLPMGSTIKLGNDIINN